MSEFFRTFIAENQSLEFSYAKRKYAVKYQMSAKQNTSAISQNDERPAEDVETESDRAMSDIVFDDYDVGYSKKTTKR